jgi:hypothetical protein
MTASMSVSSAVLIGACDAIAVLPVMDVECRVGIEVDRGLLSGVGWRLVASLRKGYRGAGIVREDFGLKTRMLQ